MKKYVILLATLFVASSFYAQTINDALRYSTVNTTGTARFQGLGGAFGALGGDLSAILVLQQTLRRLISLLIREVSYTYLMPIRNLLQNGKNGP